MSSEKKKFAKQKERERKTKAVLLRKRLASRREERAKQMEQRKLDMEEKLFRPHRPILNLETQERLQKTRDAEIKEQINRNIEMLKALQEEQIKEQEQRDKLNEELEEKGLKTLKDKLEYLQTQEKLEGELDGNTPSCNP